MHSDSRRNMERDSLLEKWRLSIYNAFQQPREESFLVPAGDLAGAIKMADEHAQPHIAELQNDAVTPFAVLSNGAVELQRALTPEGKWQEVYREPKTLNLEHEQMRRRSALEIDREDERLIQDAAKLLQNPRSLDNSEFRGHEISAQENETLDLIVQVKKHLEADKAAMAKLKSAGLSLKGIGKANLGKKGVGPLRDYEVVARTQLSAALLRGKRLYIYSLKLMELQPPATSIEQGDRVDLIWPHHRDMAKVQVNPQGLELKQTRSKVQVQSMEGM